MKFNRIYSLLLILALLISMLPGVYATGSADETVPTDAPTEYDAESDDTEASLNPALTESGFTSGQIQKSDIGLEDPVENAISTFSVQKTATLRNCDQMDIILFSEP